MTNIFHDQKKQSLALTQTQQWFDSVVLGLNLCPFAHRPARQQLIRFVVSTAENDNVLLEECVKEIDYLHNTPASECETTLIITPHLLSDFYDYQFFFSEAERKLQQDNWEGVFQLASFHPDYCFAGSEPDDASNLTNRSPFPIIHILREDSLTAVLDHVDNPEDIPEVNIKRMEALSDKEKERLFFYLDDSSNFP